jgi:hypothetical protein
MLNDKKFYIIIVIACVAIGIFFGWLLFRENVHDNGGRIDTAYEQLDRTSEYQQSVNESLGTIRDGLDGSIDTVIRIEERNESIEESVDTVTDRNETCIDLLRESAERIEESQSILARVRERGKEN